MTTPPANEDQLVSLLTRGLATRSDVVVGAGDDCAVLRSGRPGVYTLFKTDCVVEGVHFQPSAPPARVGDKAMARALSDIAAMGGAPTHALVTAGLGPTTSTAYLRQIYRGIDRTARKFSFAIVGGETSRANGAFFLSIALLGTVPRTRCILRSGGRPGDLLYVTGRLGGSLAGRHLTFTPRLREAAWLAENFKPRAMIDLSDGLAADLPRLAAASRTGYEIDPRALPRSRNCPVHAALTDGEDYELLIALPPQSASALEAAWTQKFRNLPLTRIGRLTRSGRPDLGMGYDHLRRPR